MPFATVNNTKIFYEQQGKGSNLILLAGMTANHMIWNNMLPLFSSHYTVIRPDHRGAGLSEIPDHHYKISDMSEDIVQLMDHLEIEKTDIVGHSMGSMVVQQLLLDHPDRIGKAVLCAASAKLPEAAIFYVRTKMKLLDINLDTQLICEIGLPWIFGNNFLSDPLRVQNALTMMVNNPYPQSNEGFKGQSHAIEIFDSRNKLSSIKNKILIVTGEDDLLIPTHFSEELHKKISSSTFKKIAKTGHMLHIEQPVQLADMILDFFHEHKT